MKWLTNLFDNSDKEFGRLRRIAGEINTRIEDLLEEERECAERIRVEALQVVNSAGALDEWRALLTREYERITTDLERLSGEADALRQTIETGEQTSRDLSVLLADSRQLSVMIEDRTKRGPMERRELEQEIEDLVAELQERLSELMENKSGLRDAIQAAVPKAHFHPQKAGPEEMVKQVDAAAAYLGREVAGYFTHTNETIGTLRRAIGLSTLRDSLQGADLADGAAGAKHDSYMQKLETATQELAAALHERDLVKHLARQGLRLPAELRAAIGVEDAPVAQQDNRGASRRGRDNIPKGSPHPQAPDLGPKEELSNVLYWEEQATSELLATASAVVNEDSAKQLAGLTERFAGREERLQARSSAFRARIAAARANFWQGTLTKIADIVGVEALAPYEEQFRELDTEQEELIEAVMQQDENSCAPVFIKPDVVGELMRRRDALQDETFNELMNRFRAEDRGIYDRLRLLQTEFRKDQRKDEQAVLDSLVPEAYAAMWEASRRTIGLRPYDVQFMGSIVLHEGKIAELKTGEGKTLVAVGPLYLNGLTSRGAHLCTVNEYLVKRDSDWMGPVYKMLGLSVGIILNGMASWERRMEYGADITYGTNSEFGFDYLRDNIAGNPDDMVQRVHNYCIVDEVDNILIDEARTPLIISGASEGSAEIHVRAAQFAKTLRPETDYTVDEKSRSAMLTDEGINRAEAFFRVDNLYHPDNFQLVYGVDNALKANALFRRDKDYVLWQDGKPVEGDRPNPKLPVEVVIIDEFTGRAMHGRRYSEGLHEAIEAKEGIRVQAESQTYATITIQNYFRLYPKLAGMTGTAATEAEEFHKIYKLDVIPIPTHRPMVRQDAPDRIYRKETAKFRAVVQEIREMHEEGRPVLVGTVSIEKSEELAAMLAEAGIPHSVLNAKQHEREASVVAQAGQRGAVTIATNMAGRGTDIVLGFGVNELGGLHIIGTERHESRRIDNQLRGRAGRQGDNGSSRFYVSIEDEIMRRSGVNQNLANSALFRNLWEEDMPVEHSMISRSVEQAQVKMEGHNFDIRKHLVEYDDVVNTHRDVIYGERRFVLRDGDPGPLIGELIGEKVEELAGGTLKSDDPRGKKKDNKRDKAGYSAMFESFKEQFPDEVVRRLLHSILTDRLLPLAAEGDREGLSEELKLIAQEAYDGVLAAQLAGLDERLQEFYHIGDIYYEIAGEGTLDYSKLQKLLNLSPDLMRTIEGEEMGYEEAREFLTEIVEEGFRQTHQSRLEQLQGELEAAAGRLGNGSTTGTGGDSTNPKWEKRVGDLLHLIDTSFTLSSASAARYVEAENQGRSANMMASEDDVVMEVREQLGALYEDVERIMGEVFLETNAGWPLIALVDNRLPRSVYRQIEERLGLEGLEQVENTPIAQLPQEVRDIVAEAYVRWQESDLMLRVIDYLWTRHLTTMEQLRNSIGLQAYGQKDPLVQYKVKAYELFDELKAEIRQLVVMNVLMMGSRAEAARAASKPAPQPSAAAGSASQQRAAAPRGQAPGTPKSSNGKGGKPSGSMRGGQAARPPAQAAPVGAGAGLKTKLGRNDPCFCGSGKKYKHCHGR
jgi:preprotein translocase subunit SecA